MKPDQPNKPEQVNLIENRPQFIERVNDIRGYISTIRLSLEKKENKPSFEQIKEGINKNPPKLFLECMESFNERLSPSKEGDEEYQEIITIADDFVNRIKKVEDMEELQTILDEAKDYFSTIK